MEEFNKVLALRGVKQDPSTPEKKNWDTLYHIIRARPNRYIGSPFFANLLLPNIGNGMGPKIGRALTVTSSLSANHSPLTYLGHDHGCGHAPPLPAVGQ